MRKLTFNGALFLFFCDEALDLDVTDLVEMTGSKPALVEGRGKDDGALEGGGSTFARAYQSRMGRTKGVNNKRGGLV